MKIEMIKEAGGVFRPFNDMEHDKTTRFKTGELYTVEIKQQRNYQFHKKVMSFFLFCFEYWKGDNEFQCEQKQFDVFRKNLTVLAGYYDAFYSIKGDARIEAKSISYGSMSQSEFEELYSALINAALKHVFKGADKTIENKLIAFF